MSPDKSVPGSGSDPLIQRLGKLLDSQEKHLAGYLELIERYEADVREDRTEHLALHAEAGRHHTKKIAAFARAIEPLLAGYRDRPGEDPGIEERILRIDEAVRRIADGSHRIGETLRRESEKIRAELAGLRIPKQSVSPYGRSSSSNLIDISG